MDGKEEAFEGKPNTPRSLVYVQLLNSTKTNWCYHGTNTAADLLSHYNKQKKRGRECITITNLECFVSFVSFDTEESGSASAMQSSEHSSSDILSQPLICKQKFLTVSLYFFLFSFPPHPFSFFRQGEVGPRGRNGEVCRIRLCGIRYNPFCLILHRSEKPCQACRAAIEDLQSQYLQAWGNVAPRAKIYITKALFSKGAHI